MSVATLVDDDPDVIRRLLDDGRYGDAERRCRALAAGADREAATRARLLLPFVYAKAYFALGLEPAPYFMFRHRANAACEFVSFDGDGMRTCLAGGAAVSLRAFLASSKRKGVIVGNSVTAGSGVSGDAAVVHNRLNAADPDWLWFNLSVMGHNSTQNLLALEHHLAGAVSAVVYCGGMIDYLFALSWRRRHGALPFWGEESYFGAPLDLNPELCAGAAATDWATTGWTHDAVAARGAAAIAAMAALCRRLGARLLVMLQPHLGLCAKPPSPEEAMMQANLARDARRPTDQVHGVCKRAHLQLGRWAPEIRGAFHHAAAAADVEFCDANVLPAFLTSDQMFADYIHVTDAGHAAIAAEIRRWAAT